MNESTTTSFLRRYSPITLLAGILAGLALVFLISWAIGSALSPYSFNGMVLQSPQPAVNFTLTSQFDQKISLSDYHGKLVLLYFGYASCPDVCPNTLIELKGACHLLGNQVDDVQVLMITVDPERDTIDILAEYMSYFDPRFIGLWGTQREITEIATYYGVYFERRESDSALGYLVDHTATVMVVDRDGYLRLVFPYGTKAKDIAADLEYLLRR